MIILYKCDLYLTFFNLCLPALHFRFEMVNIRLWKSGKLSIAEHLGAVVDTSPPAFHSGANEARFLQLIAALLMTGIFQAWTTKPTGTGSQSRFSPAGCVKN